MTQIDPDACAGPSREPAIDHEDRSCALFGVPLPATRPRDAFDAARAVDPSAARTIEVGIPMRDGIEIAADVHLPPAHRLPAPAIVIGTPYDKSSRVDDARDYPAAGYVTVIYDVRGRGKSEGLFHPFSRPERDDCYDIVEWVAAQPWCSGSVGVTGLSYGGWLVWTTIAERPPHLRAAVSLSPAGRWQQDLPYTYGCFWLYFAYWFAMVRRRIAGHTLDIETLLHTLPVAAIGEALDDPAPAWQEFMDHDTLDEFWRGRRWDGEYDFDIPCLHVTGWHDREDLPGAFHHYEQMMATSPARDRQWLLVGPWSHVETRHPNDRSSGVDAPGGAIDMTAIHVRFFDRFLRGDENGVDDEPKVRLYDPGARTWNVRRGWQQGTAEQRLFLGAGMSLTETAGADGRSAYRYDPLQAPGLRFDVNAAIWEPPLDLGDLESQPGVLSWTSAPLTGDLIAHGWGAAELWAATDGDDTEWHVKLADVDGDGRSLCVGWGCLRASHNVDLALPQPVVPGAVMRYEIELTPAFHTFRAGHRVRLVLASAEFPWFARSMNRFGPIATQADPRTATNTIHYGVSMPSALRLRVERAGGTERR